MGHAGHLELYQQCLIEFAFTHPTMMNHFKFMSHQKICYLAAFLAALDATEDSPELLGAIGIGVFYIFRTSNFLFHLHITTS